MKPIAYHPQNGYKWQILCRPIDSRTWEHCDYAADDNDRRYLLGEYKIQRLGWQFRSILLPMRCWPKRQLIAQPLKRILIPAHN